VEPQVPGLYAALHRGDPGTSGSLLCAHGGPLEVAAAAGGEPAPADRAQDAVAVGDAGRGPAAEAGPAVAGDRGASGGDPTIQARDQDAELAKNVDDAVMEIVKKFNEIQEQSRQAAEKKGRLRENRGRGPGVRGRKTGVKGRGSVVRRERNSRVSRWGYRRGPLGARCGGGPAGRTAEKP